MPSAPAEALTVGGAQSVMAGDPGVGRGPMPARPRRLVAAACLTGVGMAVPWNDVSGVR